MKRMSLRAISGTAVLALCGAVVASVGASTTAGPPAALLHASPGAAQAAQASARLNAAGRGTSVARRTTAAAGCHGTSAVVCSKVIVPIDRAGALPGTIALRVETLPAVGPERGVMFLLAGGPGQGSAHSFELSSPDSVLLYRFLFPGYRLVAFDNRGTGDSGLLRCAPLQANTGFGGEDALGESCAGQIGPARDFYSTHDHAEDIEAVRVAIGADRIGLWGTSYGTKLALAYALAYPTHVERLLLDSVLPTDLPDPYQANVLRDMPKALRDYCAGGVCRGATSNYAGDVVALANRLAAKPARGTVLLPSGKRVSDRVGGIELVSIVVDSDLSPGLAAQLPAAVHAARIGDPQPLLRLHRLDAISNLEPANSLSSALFAATVCADGPFPWPPGGALPERPAQLENAVASLPAGTLGPFGSWAIDLGNANLCLRWPNPAVPTPPLGSGPLPDVPVLALSGAYDMRTPTSSAVEVAALFPQGKVLVVPTVGHSVAGADPSFCAPLVVRDWIMGKVVKARCDRPKFLVNPIGAYPRSNRPPPRQLDPGATLTLVRKTVAEASAMWLMAFDGSSFSVTGLTSGKIVGKERSGFRLIRYGIAPGVEVSGELRRVGSGLPLGFEGALRVGGTSAAKGLVGLRRGKLAGTLGGKLVG